MILSYEKSHIPLTEKIGQGMVFWDYVASKINGPNHPLILLKEGHGRVAGMKLKKLKK